MEYADQYLIVACCMLPYPISTLQDVKRKEKEFKMKIAMTRATPLQALNHQRLQCEFTESNNPNEMQHALLQEINNPKMNGT